MGIVKNTLYMIARSRMLPWFKQQAIFPYYHIVRNDNVKHIENLYRYKNEAQFRADIGLLKKNYVPAEPDDILKGAIKANTFVLSFDDGLSEIYTTIFPILRRHNLKAIFFINPDFVDNENCLYKHQISIVISELKRLGDDQKLLLRLSAALGENFTSASRLIEHIRKMTHRDRPLIDEIAKELQIDMGLYLKHQKPYVSKSQIQEMLDDGQLFGGHTMSHPKLTELSTDEAIREIIGSIQWLKDNFGIKYSLFAFPFSDRGISKKVISSIFEYDPNALVFGNSGLKKDFDSRIIQRFSLENPAKDTAKQIVTEHIYKLFNRAAGKYHIARND